MYVKFFTLQSKKREKNAIHSKKCGVQITSCNSVIKSFNLDYPGSKNEVGPQRWITYHNDLGNSKNVMLEVYKWDN